MSEAFILKNQQECFLDKHGQWVAQANQADLYRTRHKDEAVNLMVEHSVKFPDLRIRIVPCELDERGRLALASTASPTAPAPPAEPVEPAGESIDSHGPETFGTGDEPA